MSHPSIRVPAAAFRREDESDDALFYARERLVSQLDSRALATIQAVIGTLVVEDEPVILDLMASWDSHLPERLRPSRMVGLGLNPKELAENPRLDAYVLHDLNRDQRLPFDDAMFDAVLCTVSVDYKVRPVHVFRDVGRILKPGGLFLVIFSDRYFAPKVVKIWRDATGKERVDLVRDFFAQAEQFAEPNVFVSRGRPRPEDDKYASLGIPSDPIYAVYADRRGGVSRRPTVPRDLCGDARYSPEEVAERKRLVGSTLRCPHCDAKLRRLPVPDTPFTEWPSDVVYVCMNDRCRYFLLGWSTMADQGGSGSYRFMFEP
ncbi:MAG: methyltransferase domain-containing protein, partial [Gemmatimonadota bacterium]